MDFEWAHKQEVIGIELQNNDPGTPQQNDHVEQKFMTLFNRVCAMLNGGKFSPFLKNDLWAEAANTAIFLENNSLLIEI